MTTADQTSPGLSSALPHVQTEGAPGLVQDIWDKIPLPQWPLLTLLVGAAFLLVSCLLCIICCCCCCHQNHQKRKKWGKETVGLGTASNSTSAHLVQPNVEDVELGLEDPKRGRLQVSLEYSFQSQELTVGLKEAAHLKALQAAGMADPYARIYLMSEPQKIYETKVHRQTLSPVFNESCIFQVPQAEMPEAMLVIQILDFQRFSPHIPIGELLIPLGTSDLHHVLEQWYELGPPGRAEQQEQMGELCFSLRYVPSTGKLTVVVLEARGLPQGLSDSYVKIQLLLNRKKWKKKTTSMKKNTSSPYFNEAFTFPVPFSQIQNVDLLVSVWGHNRMSRGEPCGKLFLGCRTTGRQLHHWSDMLAHARRPIVQWHRLQSPEEVDMALQIKKGP